MAIVKFDGEYRWLSNFWMCPVPYGLIIYPSSEHAYQAAKTTNAIDHDIILNCKTAGETKKKIRTMVQRSDFHEEKLVIMYSIVLNKFLNNPELAEKLLATGDEELIEGNTWNDTFWGVCDGIGKNNLGKILMRVRSKLIVAQELF